MDDDGLRAELSALLDGCRRGDTAAVLGPGADRLIARRTERWSRSDADIRPGDVYSLAWLQWLRSVHRPGEGEQVLQERDMAVRLFAELLRAPGVSWDIAPPELHWRIRATLDPPAALELALALGAGVVPDGFVGDPFEASAELLVGVANVSTDTETRLRALLARCHVLQRRWQSSDDDSLLVAAVRSGEQALSLAAPDHPLRSAAEEFLAAARQLHAGVVDQHARDAIERFLRSHRDEDLAAAIPLAERACAAAVAAPGYDAATALLGRALLATAHAQDSDDVSRHDESVRHHEAVLNTLASTDPRAPAAWLSLAAALLARARAVRSDTDLRRAEQLIERTRGAAPDGELTARIAAISAQAAGVAFRCAPPPASDLLDVAVDRHRAAVATDLDTVLRASLLADLGTLSMTRYLLGAEIADLDEAVAALGTARNAALAGSAVFAERSRKLARALELRYVARATSDDLDARVAALRGAATAAAGDPETLGALGAALADRGESRRDRADLVEAVALHRAAVAASVDPQERAARRGSLGSGLAALGELDGDRPALDEAVAELRVAVGEGPPAGIAYRQMNLGVALARRHQWTGELDDLVAAVSAYRAGLAVRTDADRETVESLQVNLAIALRLRADRTSSRADAAESARLYTEVATCTPAGHPRRSGRLSAAALALARVGDVPAAEQAVAMADDALAAAATPAAEQRARVLLADLLRMRSQAEGSAEAVRRGLAVLEPLTDPADGEAGSVRAGLLRELAELTGDDDVFDEAVVEAERAAAAPGAAPRRATRRDQLANYLATRYRRRQRAGDATAACASWRSVVEDLLAPGHLRFDAAARWGYLAADAGEWRSALTGFTAAVDQYGRLAWSGLRREDREANLANASGVVRDAAIAALRCGNPRLAVELLEHGRSGMWARAMGTDADRARLTALAPDLAAELGDVDSRLRALEAEPPVDDRLAELAAERDRLVERVRRLPGLADFLGRPGYDGLAVAAAGGPVVLIVVSRYRSAAIVLRAGRDPQVVELPQAGEQEVVDRANGYQRALDQLHRAQLTGDTATAVDARTVLGDVLCWLWSAVAEPVLAELAGAERVWWCPTAGLTTLPLHAAGPTTDRLGAVLDRIVSSTTPTLRALIDSRARPPAGENAGRLLLVGVSGAAGEEFLPSAVRELERIAEVHPGPYRSVLEDQATVGTVAAELAHSDWVHFSCHGSQDFQQPGRGGLVLADGRLTVADIAARVSGAAELAFLSACQTATNSARLLDESVHLAAALQNVGFRHVIATLWSIYDGTSPTIVGDVYGRLCASGRPDAGRAADALHLALRRARARYPQRVDVWSPYIHIGP